MPQKLLVRTPKTADGQSPLIENGKVAYKETLVEPGSKKYFESLNATIKQHLRHEFQLVDVDAKGNIIKPKKDEAAK